jgi:hypothetical protein
MPPFQIPEAEGEEKRIVLEGNMLDSILIETPKELVTIHDDGSMGREPKLLRVEGVTLEEALRLVTEMVIERGLSGSHVGPELEKPIHSLAASFARSIGTDSFMFFAGSSDPIFTKEALKQDVAGGVIRSLIETDIVSGCFMAAAMSGTARRTPDLSRIIIGECKEAPAEVYGGKEVGVYIRYHESSGIGGYGRDSDYDLGIFRMPIDIPGLNKLASSGTDTRIRLREKLCLDTWVDNRPEQMREVIRKIYSEEQDSQKQSWWRRVLRAFGIGREAPVSADAHNG